MIIFVLVIFWSKKEKKKTNPSTSVKVVLNVLLCFSERISQNLRWKSWWFMLLPVPLVPYVAVLGPFCGIFFQRVSWVQLWRPCDVNPPPKLRKVPCLHVLNENNKELSVVAASGVQRTHQNLYKSHSLLLPPTHLSMHDFPSFASFPLHFCF